MSKVRVGITIGDPSGIGPEIIAKALNKPQIRRLAQFCVIGDRWVFEQVTSHKSQVTSLEFIDLNNVRHKHFRFGKVRAEYGRAAMEYLKTAVDLIKRGKIDCLVTAPVSKEAINLAGYKFSGQTEFLANSTGKKEDDLVMMLLNRYLRISLVTRHLALKDVVPALNRDRIYKTIVITYRALREWFACKHPRICVASLNPHAGEAGLLGKEEIDIIIPALNQARRILKDIAGPLPADQAFLVAKRGEFDAVVAMYHDQALIPLKVLDPDSGVNISLGLDFVRTSPLHGTAFDIAGKGIASINSLVAAIKTAVECTLNQKNT